MTEGPEGCTEAPLEARLQPEAQATRDVRLPPGVLSIPEGLPLPRPARAACQPVLQQLEHRDVPQQPGLGARGLEPLDQILPPRLGEPVPGRGLAPGDAFVEVAVSFDLTAMGEAPLHAAETRLAEARAELGPRDQMTNRGLEAPHVGLLHQQARLLVEYGLGNPAVARRHHRQARRLGLQHDVGDPLPVAVQGDDGRVQQQVGAHQLAAHLVGRAPADEADPMTDPHLGGEGAQPGLLLSLAHDRQDPGLRCVETRERRQGQRMPLLRHEP